MYIRVNIQSVPRSKHCVSSTKTDHLRLYRETIAVSSEGKEKRIHTLCGQNEGLLNGDSVATALFHIFRYVCLFYIYLYIYVIIVDRVA
jgi:hypothetical protein